MRFFWSVLVVGLLALPAWAIPVVDGTKDAEYGAALAVQTVETQFGDANPNNGSELDAGYAKCCTDGNFYMMLTGNIEANFNKLEIFIDSKPGGQSVFTSAGNDNAGNMNGLVFDPGFTADYHLDVRRGTDGTGNDKFDVDFADLGAASFSAYADVLGGLTGSGSTGTGVNAQPIQVAYDNSNTAGVLGGTNAANQAAAAAVTTGLELGIALSDLGSTGGPIRIMVGQNGGNHDYWSNQFLGGLAAPQGNLGGDGAGNYIGGPSGVNMTSFAGNQYFTACPEPSSLVLFGLALVGFACGRKR